MPATKDLWVTSADVQCHSLATDWLFVSRCKEQHAGLRLGSQLSALASARPTPDCDVLGASVQQGCFELKDRKSGYRDLKQRCPEKLSAGDNARQP